MTLDAAAEPVVLVVDDDPALRDLFSVALGRAGYEVLVAPDGRSALDILGTFQVDIIVCDIGLPGMSGLDVVRALRSQPATRTLPVILVTGTSGHDSLVSGLEAGADDFLSKPVRLDELVARVRAHLRTKDQWLQQVEDDLGVRTRVVQALGSLRATTDPEDVAEAVVRELADSSKPDFASVLQVTPEGTLQELATFTPAEGVRRGARLLPEETGRQLLERARNGPWMEDFRRRSTGRGSPSFEAAGLAMYASAPIYSGSELVGLLSIGIADPAGQPRPNVQARLLASASDYSNVLTVVAGRAIADRRDLTSSRQRLLQLLEAGAFQIVFQPVVALSDGTVAGYEALSRFDDLERPDQRFAEAWAAGVGPEFELAAFARAIGDADALPASAFLAVNVSPRLVLGHAERLRSLIESISRRVVLELTENVAIDDYAVLRARLDSVAASGIAVDDAGAGYASLRHILELGPTFAKLDISLVRGIDGDDLRQAMAAGLQYFALRTACELIAEGVETAAEAETLRRIGVEYAQGYLFGEPSAARSFSATE